MPQDLIDREIGHHGLTELRVVGSMHERKALMAELSDGFVALPGGAGTLEELIEVYTWSQLGLHRKPMGVLNVARLLRRARRAARPRRPARASCASSTARRCTSPPTPAELLERFAGWEPRYRRQVAGAGRGAARSGRCPLSATGSAPG